MTTRTALVLALLVAFVGQARATDVQGSIFVDTTWKLVDSPFVVKGDITIANQARLTIEPGVVVKVAATDLIGGNLDTARNEIIVHGELLALGTATNRIQFIPETGTAARSWYGIRVLNDARDVTIAYCDVKGTVLAVTTESPFTLNLHHDAFTNQDTVARYVDVQPNAVFNDNTVTGNTTAAPMLIVNATTASSFTLSNNVMAGAVEGLQVTNASSKAYTLTMTDTTLDGNVTITSSSAQPMTVAFNRNTVQTGGVRITTTGNTITANLTSTVVERSPREGFYLGPKVTANVDRCSARASKDEGIEVLQGGTLSNNTVYYGEIDGLALTKVAGDKLIVTNNTILYNGGRTTTDAGIQVLAGVNEPAAAFLLQNNIVIMHPRFGIRVAAGATPVLHNNDVWNDPTATNYSGAVLYQGITADVNSVSLNPLFVDGLKNADVWGGLDRKNCTQANAYERTITAVAASCAKNGYCTDSCSGSSYCTSYGCASSSYEYWRDSCTGSGSVPRSSDMIGNGATWWLNVTSVSTTNCSGNTYTSTGWKTGTAGNATALTVNGTQDHPCGNYSTACANGASNCGITVTSIKDGCPLRLTGYSLAYNLALNSYSPLIDLGVNTDGPATDYDGAPRPFDGNFDGNPKDDIGAFEFGPVGIVIKPDTTSLTQGSSVTFKAYGVDNGGTQFPIAGATWSVTDASVGWINQSGVFTAKDKLGTFAGAIKAVYGSMQDLADVTVTCRCTVGGNCTALPACFLAQTCTLDGFCALDHLAITPATASVQIQKTQQFSVAGYDAFDNPLDLGAVTWTVVNGGGEIDHTGLFFAHFTTGSYPNTVKAESGGKTAYASVNVLPGQLASIVVVPATGSVTVGEQQQFAAVAYDDQGNVVPDVAFTWKVEQGGGTIAANGTFTAGCALGTFTDTIAASFGAVAGHATVTVGAGGATLLTVTPDSASLAVGAGTTFTAKAYDACNNLVPATPTWSVVAGGGVINTTSGQFTAGCAQGTFTNTVQATFGLLTARASVTVQPGQAVQVIVTPPVSDVPSLGTVGFTAQGFDACGNPVPVAPAWSVTAGGGTIDPSTGLFNAGCDLGSFANSITATVAGAAPGLASVTVVPGAVATATLEPKNPNVNAGATQQFLASALDACGHPSTAAPVWSATGGGTIDQSGLYTAGCVPGTFANSVVATWSGVSVKTGVTVLSGAQVTVVVTPAEVSLGPTETRKFTATGKDACGNPVAGSPTWAVVNGGGSIAPDGTFAAGSVMGTYANTVKATMGGIDGFASVTVHGGPVTGVAVLPATTTLQPEAQLLFTAKASDAFGNSWDVTPTWSVVNGGGSIAADGRFTAGTVSGTYANTVKAAYQGFTAYATVKVNPTAVATLTVAPSAASVVVQGTQQFTATARDAYGNVVDTGVVWSIAAGGGAVDQAGLFTAGTKTGTFAGTVKATAGTVSGTASVTVTAGALASVAVQPASTSVEVGKSVQFAATGADAFGNAVTISPTWSVVNGGGTIGGTGLFTADTVAGTFSATVRAAQGAIGATASVTVTAGPVASVGVTPASVELAPNRSQQFVASCLDAYGNDAGASATWSVVNGGGTIDATGLFTAGTLAGSYTGTVRASCSGKLGSASVTVAAGPLATLTVKPSTATVAVTAQVDFEATGADAYGNAVPVVPVWSVVVGGGTIDATGLFTAGTLAGQFPGTVRALVGSVAGAADVTVTPGPLAALTLTPTAATVPVDGDRTFAASGVDAYGNPVVLTQPVEWSLVNGGGSIGATTGLFKPGCTLGTFAGTVRAVSGSAQGTAGVTVQAGSAVELALLPDDAALAVGETAAFTATGYDKCGNVLDVSPTWSVSGGAGSIKPWGLFTAGTVAGSFPNAVTATLGTLSASVGVIVLPGAAATLAVSPSEAALIAGAQQQFSSTAHDKYGNATVAAVSWSVVNGGGIISPTGLFTADTGVGTYTDTVKATYGDLAATATVVILPEAVASVDLTPASAELLPAGQAQFSARCLDKFGNPTAATPSWSVVNGGGTVDTSGLFLAGVVAGTYPGTVKATCGDVSATAAITVKSGALSVIHVSPPSATLAPTGTLTFTATGVDAWGNPVALDVQWSADVAAGSIGATSGLFTAGTKAGGFPAAVKATVGGVSGSADVTVQAGPLAVLSVSPAVVISAVRATVPFSVTGADAWGNAVAVTGPVFWSVVNGGGTIDATTGLFTAGCKTGTFDATVKALSGVAEGRAGVTLVAGAPVEVAIDPVDPSVVVTESVTFSASGFDSCGNPVEVDPTWSVVNGGGTVSTWGKFTAGKKAGPFDQTVQAVVGDLTATTSVTVTAGAVATLAVAPTLASLKPGATEQFTAEGLDAWGNPAPAAVSWTVVAGGGSISSSGLFTAGTVPGTFPDTVRARTATDVAATATVVVESADLQYLTLTPTDVTLKVGDGRLFAVSGFDGYGNVVPITPTWEVVNGGGAITAGGYFTAGHTAGIFADTVRVTAGGMSKTATVVVEPGLLATLTVQPAQVTLAAGVKQAFVAAGADAYGNETVVTPEWSVKAGGGSIDASGVFTAGGTPGVFADTVQARSGVVKGTASVEVVPGPAATVEVTPASVTLPLLGQQAFSASVSDAFGNALVGAPVTWSCTAVAGSIDATGTFTAGTTPGAYDGAVQATVGAAKGSAKVTLPVDYDGDGVPDTTEVELGLDPADPADAVDDPDEDGLTTVQEVTAHTDPFDADSDDDGVVDGSEASWDQDSDDDQAINALDADSDDDGLFDGTEEGVDGAGPDTDVDAGHFVADTDITTTTDPLKADTDGDGQLDGAEDANHDGHLDPGETDPNDPDGLVLCVETADCPEGLECGADGWCHPKEPEVVESVEGGEVEAPPEPSPEEQPEPQPEADTLAEVAPDVVSPDGALPEKIGPDTVEPDLPGDTVIHLPDSATNPDGEDDTTQTDTEGSGGGSGGCTASSSATGAPQAGALLASLLLALAALGRRRVSCREP